MYSKEESAQIRKKFWISFGQYMKLQPTASGLAVNWINYKTGIKDLYFKTDVDNKVALFRIEISVVSVDIRHLIFEQFEEYKPFFESIMGSDWLWLKDTFDEHGRQVCRIENKLENVNIFRESDWPEIVNFLKENLIAMDEFWEVAKHAFEIFK